MPESHWLGGELTTMSLKYVIKLMISQRSKYDFKRPTIKAPKTAEK